MTQSNLPPIRSKDERGRAAAASAAAPGGSNGSGASPPDDSSPDGSAKNAAAGSQPAAGDGENLDELRRSAHAMGYEIRREPRRRRPRPESRDGRVSTTCRLDPAVRDALDQARLQLNMNYSDMINAGVVLFLESQNLRVGVSHEDFLPG